MMQDTVPEISSKLADRQFSPNILSDGHEMEKSEQQTYGMMAEAVHAHTD